jgi:hypothetical protein
VLGTTGDNFKHFARVLAELNKAGEVVVLGSAEAIEKANKEKAGFLKVKKVM